MGYVGSDLKARLINSATTPWMAYRSTIPSSLIDIVLVRTLCKEAMSTTSDALNIHSLNRTQVHLDIEFSGLVGLSQPLQDFVTSCCSENLTSAVSMDDTPPESLGFFGSAQGIY